MSKKTNKAVKIGIAAAVIGAVGATVAGILSNKKARKSIAKGLKNVENKAVKSLKKKVGKKK